MIVEDKEVSFSRVFIIVGLIVFFSSLIYISVITSRLISLRKNRILRDNVAKEKFEKQITPSFTPEPTI